MDQLETPATQPRMKACPYCAEIIKYEAVICRYCGHDTRVPVPPPSDVTSPDDQSAQSRAPVSPSPNRKGIWRYATPAALLTALIAAYPRLAAFPSVLADAAEGRVSIAFLRGYENDLVIHFFTNWLLWTLAVAAIIAGWRVARSALLVLLGLLIIVAALLVLSGGTNLLMQAPIPSTPWQLPTPTSRRLPSSTPRPLPTSTARVSSCTCPPATAEYLSTLVDGQPVCLTGEIRVYSMNLDAGHESIDLGLESARVEVQGPVPSSFWAGDYAAVTAFFWRWSPDSNAFRLYPVSWENVKTCP